MDMDKILEFLTEIGKLNKIKRKGITFYGVRNPDSATDHSFRMALMVWIFAKEKNLNIEKALKIALIHDICKVYTGDITPYDGLLPRNKKEREKFVRKWRRLSQKEKEKRYIEKFKKEYKAILKLASKLPPRLKKEMVALWLDYAKAKSQESKFVYQIDATENLVEAFECWKKNKKFPTRPWWQHIDEIVDNPVLLKFLEAIEKKELEKRKKPKKRK